MISRRLWSSTSRRLAFLLLAVVVPPAATLVWLGALLLQQDRVVIAQRELERRTAVAQAVALELRRSLEAAERLLDGGELPEGMVRLVFTQRGVEASPATRLLWTPTPRRLQRAEEQLFTDGTTLEYRGDTAGALKLYESFAGSTDPAVRAGALRRIARVHWRTQRWEDALASYRTLSEIRDVEDLQIPVDLLARRSLGDTLQAAGRVEELEREVARLQRDLLNSHWSLDRVAWDLTAGDINRWRGDPVPVPADRRVVSLVVERLWRQFLERGLTSDPGSRRLIDVDGASVTLLERASDDTLTVIAVPSQMLANWGTSAVAGVPGGEARLAFLTPSGSVIAGDPPGGDAPAVTMRASDSGLPWALALHSGAWAAAGDQFADRQRLLLAGLASILLLLGGGSYFLWHVVQRELAVSRLQTEFVAAVSHEFRTPLTSLRHITELLEEDDEMPAHRRRSFYEVYKRNTERLHQLVESLLDFARMEAGRRTYDRQPIDLAALAAHVVAEFRHHAAPSGSRVTLETDQAAGLQTLGDRAALINALWNLLDNAVKYSPAGGPIHVSVAPHDRGAAIAVTDSGLGIAGHERATIFERFVRGRQAVEHGIKGTGLGLAMVAHIARAHGGEVDLESQEGVGSTFRIILPTTVSRAEPTPRYELA